MCTWNRVIVEKVLVQHLIELTREMGYPVLNLHVSGAVQS